MNGLEAIRELVEEERHKLERMCACGAPGHLVALQRIRFTRLSEAAERLTNAHTAHADD